MGLEARIGDLETRAGGPQVIVVQWEDGRRTLSGVPVTKDELEGLGENCELVLIEVTRGER